MFKVFKIHKPLTWEISTQGEKKAKTEQEAKSTSFNWKRRPSKKISNEIEINNLQDK